MYYSKGRLANTHTLHTCGCMQKKRKLVNMVASWVAGNDQLSIYNVPCAVNHMLLMLPSRQAAAAAHRGDSPELSPTTVTSGQSETQCFSVFSVPCSAPDPTALMLLRNQMAGLEFYDAVLNNELQQLKRLVAQYKLDLNAKFQQVRNKQKQSENSLYHTMLTRSLFCS